MPIHLNPVFLWHHALDNSFDLRPLLDEDDAHLVDDELYYRLKAAIAQLCQPERTLQLGVGDGYATAALLSGIPRSCYVVVDQGSKRFDQVRIMLVDRYPKADLRFIEADTQHDATPWLRPLLVEGQFNLVFLAGDQSRRTCEANLQIAYWAVHSGGFILIDSYDACRGVRTAVHDFLFASSLPHIYCCTTRGDMLINVHKK